MDEFPRLNIREMCIEIDAGDVVCIGKLYNRSPMALLGSLHQTVLIVIAKYDWLAFVNRARDTLKIKRVTNWFRTRTSMATEGHWHPRHIVRIVHLQWERSGHCIIQ